MALAALFPLKTTSRTTINLEFLTGPLHDLCVCTLRRRVCVVRYSQERGVSPPQ